MKVEAELKEVYILVIEGKTSFMGRYDASCESSDFYISEDLEPIIKRIAIHKACDSYDYLSLYKAKILHYKGRPYLPFVETFPSSSAMDYFAEKLIDLEELKDIQQAISKVKEMASISNNKVAELDIIEELETSEAEIGQVDEYLSQREAMASDFSDLEGIPFEELQDMREAIESVKKEQVEEASDITDQSAPKISSELEERIKQELLERRVEEEKEVVTAEKFLDYIKEKRDKVWRW